MTTTTTGSRTIRRVNDFKVVRDTKTYRQISLEGEADPMATALKRARKRFRSNVQMETERYIPLESIRVAYIPANAEQLEQTRGAFGDLLGTVGAELRLSLPYAVSGGRAYLLLDTFASLDSEQIQAFFEDELFPFMTESGLDADEVEPVLVPNRQR